MTSWLIGSGQHCDLVVEGSTVSAEHCMLVQAYDGYILEDLGSTNGTFVNGTKLTSAKMRVTRTDSITLGHMISMPWPEESIEQQVVGKERSAGETVEEVEIPAEEIDEEEQESLPPLDPPPERVLKIGKAATNDRVIDRPMVSGYHARIRLRGDEITIEDNDSTNGTAVGSRANRIKTAPVSRKDLIFFGSFSITLEELLENRIPDNTPLAAPPVQPPQVATGKPAERQFGFTAVRKVTDKVVQKLTENKLTTALSGVVVLLVVLFLIVWLVIPDRTNPAPADLQDKSGENSGSDSAPQDEPQQASPPETFAAGDHGSGETVRQLRATIWIADGSEDVKEPLDLDLGFEQTFRLGHETSATGSTVQMPSESSTAEARSLQPGRSVWFKYAFSQDSAPDCGQIDRIRFVAEGRSDWTLTAYEIEINGRLFAKNPRAQWKVNKATGTDSMTLGDLLVQQEKLEERVQELEDGGSDPSGLQETKNELDLVAESIRRFRGGEGVKLQDYREADPAFQPPASK